MSPAYFCWLSASVTYMQRVTWRITFSMSSCTANERGAVFQTNCWYSAWPSSTCMWQGETFIRENPFIGTTHGHELICQLSSVYIISSCSAPHQTPASVHNWWSVALWDLTIRIQPCLIVGFKHEGVSAWSDALHGLTAQTGEGHWVEIVYTDWLVSVASNTPPTAPASVLYWGFRWNVKILWGEGSYSTCVLVRVGKGT